MEHFLLDVRSERIARKEELLDLVDVGLAMGRGGSLGYTDFVEMVSSAGEDAVRRGMPSTLPAVAEFLTRWRDQNVGILRLVVPGHEGKFAFRLMDPSVLSKRVFDQVHASVLMSGTLFPADMYADLLGIDLDRRLIRTYGTPFPKANRLLLVQPELTTLYAKRSAAMHDRIAQRGRRLRGDPPHGGHRRGRPPEPAECRGRGFERVLLPQVRVRERVRLRVRLPGGEQGPSGRRPSHPERARSSRHHSLGGPSARTAVRAVPATRFRAKAVQGACVRDPYVPRGVAPDWFLGG